MIKIDNSPLPKTVSASRLKSKSKGASFQGQIGPQSSPHARQETSDVVSISALSPMNELLHLQEISLDDTPLKNSSERGGKILTQLTQLQQMLLYENFSESDLKNLAQTLKQNSVSSKDPRLDGLIQEIEQRLAIELTKFEMSKL